MKRDRGPDRRVATRGRLFKRAALVALACASGPIHPSSATAQVPPDADWRTLTTEHFRVSFPVELEPLGRRAADRAERAWTALEAAFLEPPSGRIDLLVVDNLDVSNGFAQITPSNRITVYARPPVDDPGLGYFDDWMELVITHELAHIVHLDRAGTPLGSLLRGVFGRVNAPWPFFPGTGTPRWVTEGVATWYESRLSGAGRTDGTFHEMVLRTAALEGRFESLGQASGESPLWPGGNRSYVYGSLFFEHLLERHGEDKMAAFVEAVAGQWVPYRLDAAGREAFGVSLSEEWRSWAGEVRADIQTTEQSQQRLGPVSAPERLTRGARWALYPRLSPDGETLAYARSDGRSDIALQLAGPAGEGGRALTRTNGLAAFDWLPDGSVLFAQLENEDPYRLRSDLYVAAPGGAVRRVTAGARLDHPAAGPDGRWAVAVEQGGGTNALVRVDLGNGSVRTLVAAEADVHWAFPRPSPDGRWIAATRWSVDAFHDVVILDAEGRLVAQVTADRALDLAPSWSPDGRHLVWMSDRTGVPNVLGVDVDPSTGAAGSPVLHTNVLTGAGYPSVDPSGAWLYLSGYHVDGWEIERVPFRTGGIAPAPEPAPRFAATGPARERGSAAGEVAPYSPWPTLRPHYWEPLYREPVVTPSLRTRELFLRGRELLGPALGAQTGGIDATGRHAYGAVLRVFTDPREGATLPSGMNGRVEGGLSYSWAGLGDPVLTLSASQFWDEEGPRVARREESAPLDTLYVLERDRSLSASLTFRRTRVRNALVVTGTGSFVQEDAELLGNDLQPATRYNLRRPQNRLGEMRLSLTWSSARSHSFAMGGARGATLFLTGRARRALNLPDSLRGVVGSDGALDDVQGRVRLYQSIRGPGFADHVLAVQAGAGAARGPDAGAGHFDVGGASGSPESITGLELFGGGSIFFPVRGYETSTRFGRYAWSASAEYRVPLGLLNRGLGAWPLHFDRVVGAVFFDAGNAWGPDVSASGFLNPRRASLASVGAEVTAQVLTFFKTEMRFRGGAAFPLVEGDGARVYLRLGLPF